MFRQAAIHNQNARLNGEVVIARRPQATLLTAALCIMVIAIMTFLSVASFSRKETVSGYLKPDQGLAKVSSSRAGVVKALYVEEGQLVNTGDRIALAALPEQLARGDDLTETLQKGLSEQIDLISLRQSELQHQFDHQKKEYITRLTLSQNLLRDIHAQQALLTKRLSIQRTRYESLQHLWTLGAISPSDVQKQEELLLGMEQQWAALRANEQTQRAQVVEMGGLLERLPYEKEQQQALLNGDIARLRHQQIEMASRGEWLITAPIPGRVTNILAEIGSTLGQGLPILTIMPKDASLRAVLLVPTRAFGFIQTGQVARLRFDAFPYQRFGLHDGTVVNTAKTIILPNEIPIPAPIQEPVYRVEVALAQQYIDAYGEQLPLQSGMLVNADIILEQRSVLAWLFDPLLSLKGRV
jgi:membrane fusion protein